MRGTNGNWGPLKGLTPRWLMFGAAPVVVGGSLALGLGASWRTSEAVPDAHQPPAAGPRPPANPAPAPGPDAQDRTLNTERPTPQPDPRIVRALNTRVRLQAGKASLWTELRRLGVDLTWPQPPAQGVETTAAPEEPAPSGEPQWRLDDRRFERALHRLARRVERMPRNVRLLHQRGAFHIVPGHPGRRLDRAEARRQLLAALAKPAFRHSLDAPLATKPDPIVLSVPLREVAPTVSGTHLGAINTLLATYSTALGGSSRNRRHNIQVACEAIDGTVLVPGQVFSYNDTVGPRSERAGFRTAPVIIRGELVPGTGGGVCQVSSTLYNAALLADFKIVRRSHHQFPVHYVPPGRDATVAYGSLDLRFANRLPGPVALDVKTNGSRVIVHVFGTPGCQREVRLISSRVTATRPRVPATGGPARPGKRVTVSREVRLPDGTVQHEQISHDVYAPPPASGHRLPTHPRRAHRPGHRRLTAPKEHSPPTAPDAAPAPAPSAPAQPGTG